MPEIIKTYKQSVPAMRFIGKQYGDSDRVNGSFGTKWCEWIENNLFDVLKKQVGGNPVDTCEDGDAAIGLMREKHGEPFQYWIGMFVPSGTSVPEGFDCVDFPEGKFGICWLYGKENELYMNEGQCWEKLAAEGMEGVLDENGACWFFERYAGARFDTPDEKGNVVLDIGFFVK